MFFDFIMCIGVNNVSYKIVNCGGHRDRRNFSKIRNTYELKDLLEIQKKSYHWFLEEGIKENCFFRAYSKDLSQKILKSSDKFSFVSVEKKGRLLIIEAYGVTQPPEPLDFKKEKIVSPVKGEVISINLMGGTATVSVGDKVKTGQTLIGGYKVDGETEVKTYALGEVEIKAEFVYEYKSFAKGEKYKNRAITVAKEMLGEESVIEILVEEKENNQQIIYKITLFYTVIAS